MRRIVLVLALTALLVAVAVTGSALAQVTLPQSCEGQETAVLAQEDEPLPPSDNNKVDRGIGEGAENSGLRDKVQDNPNCKLEPPPP
jgi:hypothetical protein